MTTWRSRLLQSLLLALLASFMAIPAAQTARAEDDPMLQVATALAPQVIRVRTFGQWQEAENKGFYRGILVRKPPADGKPVAVRLYLQWLQIAKDGTLSVVRTITFPKLAEAEANVTDFRYEKDTGGLVLFIDTLHARTRADTTWELFLRSPEDYDLRPASN